MEQNINAEGTSEVQEKTRGKNIERFKQHNYTTINCVLGQAHYTKNDNYALKKVLEVRRWRLNIKVKEGSLRRGKQGLVSL